MGGSLSRIASAFVMISICCWAYLEVLGSRRIASILRVSLSRLVKSLSASLRVNPGELCLRALRLFSFTPDPTPLDLPSSDPPISTSTADARPGGPGGPQPGGGVALAFGNERRGCSRALVAAGDGTFFLPMSGFTQSFNIGVAVAMSLAAAIDSGAFPMGTLSEDERAELLGRWLIRDMKAAPSLLLQVGLEFEDF